MRPPIQWVAEWKPDSGGGDCAPLLSTSMSPRSRRHLRPRSKVWSGRADERKAIVACTLCELGGPFTCSPACPSARDGGSRRSGATLATKTRSSFLKRQKEVSRQARMKEKQSRRLEAKQKNAEAGTDAAPDDPAEDPDLAGIVLGPQPRADECETEEDE